MKNVFANYTMSIGNIENRKLIKRTVWGNIRCFIYYEFLPYEIRCLLINSGITENQFTGYIGENIERLFLPNIFYT